MVAVFTYMYYFSEKSACSLENREKRPILEESFEQVKSVEKVTFCQCISET